VPGIRHLTMGSQQRRRAQAWGLALVLAALTAMAGCAVSRPSRPAADQRAPGAVTSAQAVITINASTLRWDWYVSRAEQFLTAQCMRSHGFQYTVPAFGPEPSVHTVTAYALGGSYPATYGVTPQSFASSDPHDPGDAQRPYQYALEGPATLTATLALPGGGGVFYGTGGCIGFARQKLFGSVRAYVESSYVPQTVRSRFGTYLSTYRPYLDALHRWQSCMKAGGRKFQDPQAAIESVQALAMNGMRPAGLVRRETALADTDTTCDSRSHLRASTSQALARYARSLPSRTLAQLSSIHSSRETALQVAQRVLAG
jgi:hypothetical protein